MAAPIPPNQNVNVNFEAAGLGKLKTQWLDFAGELLEPMVILAAGGTKASAAWAGFRGTMLTKVLGPLGMVAGASAAFLLTTRKLVGEWAKFGMVASKEIERATLQFKPLLGSMELAKKRAMDIFKFGAKTPFEFTDSAEGGKILETMTRGALSGAKGMNLVGDAAAVAGTSFSETATQVGRMYDGLMSGRPVGMVSMRLQELGLISGETRNQVESMQAANVAGSEVWRVVERDLKRVEGAMGDMENTLSAMESTFRDTEQQLQAGFSDGFMEGEKAGIRSSIELMEKMTPVAIYFGEQFGSVSNAVAKFKARVLEVVTGFPGFENAVKLAVGGLILLTSTIVAATGGLIAKFVIGIFSASFANKQLAKSALGAAGATAVQTGVTANLANAQKSAAAVSAALAGKQYVLAASHLQAAAASTLAAAKTNLMTTAQALFRGSLKLTWGALKFVTAQILLLGQAMALNPVVRIAMLLLAAGAALKYFYNSTKKATEALEAYARVTRDVLDTLDAQIRGVRTLADLRKTEADVMRNLAEAHLEYYNATREGDDAQAAQAALKIKETEVRLTAVRNKGADSLVMTEPQKERDEMLYRGDKQVAEMQADYGVAGQAGAESERAAQKLAELESRKTAAEAALDAEKALDAARTEVSRKTADMESQEPALQARRDMLKAGLEEAASNGSQDPDSLRMFTDKKKEWQDWATAAREELVRVEASLEAVADARLAADAESSGLALDSGSELAVLREKITLIDAEKAAIQGAVAARKALADAVDARKGLGFLSKADDKKEADAAVTEARAGLELAERQKRLQTELATKAGVSGLEAGPEDVIRTQAARMEAERNEAEDPVKLEEARQRASDAELALARVKLDTESQIAGLRLKGYEREKELLDIEYRKLAAVEKAGKIKGDDYTRTVRELNARSEALAKEAKEKAVELRSAFEISKLRRLEEAARRDGGGGKADALRAMADAREDARTRRDAEKEAAETGASPEERKNFVDASMAENREAREQQRAEEERGKRLGREGVLADQGSAAAGIGARVLELQGKGKQAKELREQAARQQDEVDRQEKQRAFREQGFSGKEADAMANKDIKTQQAERLMQDMMGGQGNVIASSLAAVGGGGNVTGSDPGVKLQERMVKLLEDLNSTAKENVDTMK